MCDINHTYCTKYCQDLLKEADKKIPDQHQLNIYFKNLFNYFSCALNNLECLSVLLKFGQPSHQIVHTMISSNNGDILKLLEDNNVTFCHDCLVLSIFNVYDISINFITKSPKFTPTILALDSLVTTTHVVGIKNLLLRKMAPNYDIINKAIKLCDNDIVELMISLVDYKCSVEQLIIACIHHKDNLMEIFLENCIKPNRDCYTALFAYQSENNYVLYQKKINDLINLLVKYGYKITEDDVIYAIQKNIKIINVKSKNIVMTDKIIGACMQNGFFPFEKDEIPQDSKIIENVCSQYGALKTIKNLHNGGIKLTKQCLINAAKIKGNYNTIKYLVDHGVEIDYEIVKIVGSVIHNSSLDFLIQNFEG